MKGERRAKVISFTSYLMFHSPSWPRISVITPSYNQGSFIEQTIQSVIQQGYPNLEYIIIDGGSTDQTLEILQRYDSQITDWVSEPDRGQSHAINKGLARATGEILAYLNSDDYYLPHTLFTVATYYQTHPHTDLLHGRCRYVNETGETLGEQWGNIESLSDIVNLWEVWWAQRQWVQPEVFWTRRITEKIGGFREDLTYAMDYDYWGRILQAGGTVGRMEDVLACFRFTPQQKSTQHQRVAEELLSIVHPWLWSEDLSLPWKQRLRLQGRWLHQAVLLSQVEQSVQRGDRPLRRWLQSAQVVLTHPQVLLAPSFQHRAMQWFSRLTDLPDDKIPNFLRKS